MADVRSLLRQQRAARRIEHPLAAYSDAGKLLCTLCREAVRAESLWEAHVRGEGHKQRLKTQATTGSHTANGGSGSHLTVQEDSTSGDDAGGSETSHKRKLVDETAVEDVPMEDYARRKRSRPDDSSTPSSNGDKDTDAMQSSSQRQLQQQQAPNRTLTPPNTLQRRTSGTPSQGVELQIPSRPATPAAAAAAPASLSSRQSTLAAAPSSAAAPVDEDEWAAFEADIAASSYATDAVISAPAMTADESAAAAAGAVDGAAAGDENDEQRRARAAADREDAARTLEDEFVEMEELESRVRRLKEQREAVRRRSRAASQGQVAMEEAKAAHSSSSTWAGDGKENVEASIAEEEDDEDEGDEDDWDGFRFRAA